MRESRAISARLAGFRPFPGAHRPPPDAPSRAVPVHRAGGAVRAPVPSPRPALSQTIPRPSAPAFLSCRLISAKTPPEQQLSPKFLSYPPPELAWAVGRRYQPSKCSNDSSGNQVFLVEISWTGAGAPRAALSMSYIYR